ncbi:MAG: efflux RND transporter permease subunit, partial [Myxococcota bacterium]|nr:efflux RND transporter permease subunit [Myxococcota bacterium]
QQRAAVVSANFDGFDLGGRVLGITSSLEDLALDLEWEVGGQSREMDRSLASLRIALVLALFLVYVIMASTFESVVHPFVILFSV